VKTDEEITLFIQLEHVNNQVTYSHLLISFSQMSSIGKYLHYRIFTQTERNSLSMLNKAKTSLQQLKPKNLQSNCHAWYSPKPCDTVRIATKNETKQTRHHRKIKRSLLINTT